MPVCFFNSNFTTKYNCEYEIKDGTIEIAVDYDISDEIESINGMKIFGGNTKFEPRDIFVVDYQGKKNYLAKQAHCSGISSVFGTPDNGSKTKFCTNMFFEHSDIEQLSQLPSTPKVIKIKLTSKSILDWIGYPSLQILKTEGCYTINLSKDYAGRSIDVNANNINRLTVSDTWESVIHRKDHAISIDFNGYVEIELVKRVNYDKVYEYVNELLVFMQLYCPDKFLVDKISTMVDGVYYELHMPIMEMKHKDKQVEVSVKSVGLLEFLKECYVRIPYRNSKTYIRNIPYITLRTSRSIEDNFLMFYRFIECFYKQTSGKSKTFVSNAINEHYASKNKMSEEQIESYIQEIICLRNHYVHAGYYIKNGSLRIKFDPIDGKKNPQNYTANGVDAHWIYERTNILYRIVVDIIFTEMLGYKAYQFKRHF